MLPTKPNPDNPTRSQPSQDTYVGWIPSTSGRLSFSVIGQVKWPTLCRGINVLNGGKRHIYLMQERDLSDSLAWKWLFELVTGLSKDFIFLLASDDASDREINGKVYVFLKSDWHRRMENKSPESKFRDESSPKKMAALVKDIGQNCFFSCNFSILRDGITRLSGLEYRLRTAQNAADEYTFPHRLANEQIFYFLKDICHKHKHHPPKHDSIVSVHKEDPEFTWVRKTFCSMNKFVIDSRRRDTTASHTNALGVLAYMAAFRDAIGRRYKLKEGTGTGKETGEGPLHMAQEYRIKEVEDSVKANLDRMKTETIQWNLLAGGLPIVFLSSMNLLKSTQESKVTIGYSIYDFVTSIFPNNLSGLMILLYFAYFYIFKMYKIGEVSTIQYVREKILRLDFEKFLSDGELSNHKNCYTLIFMIVFLISLFLYTNPVIVFFDKIGLPLMSATLCMIVYRWFAPNLALRSIRYTSISSLTNSQ